MNPPARHPQGFTLAEIAVVLVIVALLLGGLLAPLASQNDARLRSENAKSLADIREALIGFAVINGRLPCPANRAQATGTGGAACPGAAGCESIAGAACTSSVGALPWATLGLSETDAWNNRFTYRVTPLFARTLPQAAGFGCVPSTPPANAAFALCSPGDITVQNSAGTALASQIPAIVVSHGKNGLGAWLPSGAQTPLGAAADENENADDDTTFVSDANIDDQLIWIPPNILMNRMIAAGKLP